MVDDAVYSAETVEIPQESDIQQFLKAGQNAKKAEDAVSLTYANVAAAASTPAGKPGTGVLETASYLPQTTPTGWVSDTNYTEPPTDLIPIASFCAVILAAALTRKYWLPRLHDLRAYLQNRPDAVIVAGVASAIFDWRVIPHLLEDGLLPGQFMTDLHDDGWLFMAATALALMGCYWKMRPNKPEK